MTSYVLPKTEKAIMSKVTKKDKSLNTPGKVLDQKFSDKP